MIVNVQGPLDHVAGWIGAFIDLLYPPVCPLCYRRLEREDKTVCWRCAAAMRFEPEWQCTRCGASGSGTGPTAGGRCRLCPPEGSAWRGALAVTPYLDPASRCVHLFKYQRRLELGDLMARRMREELSEAVRSLGGRLDVVAPVPLHWLRRAGRGFNQSERLARELAAGADRPCDARLLRRVKYTRRQALVPRAKRASNVAGAFALRAGRDVRDRGVLIVDDVVTSGSTIDECAKVLCSAGAREVWVACFARVGMGEASEELV